VNQQLQVLLTIMATASHKPMSGWRMMSMNLVLMTLSTLTSLLDHLQD